MARLFDYEVLGYEGTEPETAPHLPGYVYLARRSTPDEAIALAEHWLKNNLSARPIVGIDYAKHTDDYDNLASFDEFDWELQDQEDSKWRGVCSRNIAWEPRVPRPPVIQFRDDFGYPYQLNDESAGDGEATWLVHVDNQFSYDQFGRFFVDIRDYSLDACGMGVNGCLTVARLAGEFLDDFYGLTPDSPDTEFRPCIEYLDNFDGRARIIVPLQRYREYESRAHEQRSIIFSR